jgi:hypothetical protein
MVEGFEGLTPNGYAATIGDILHVDLPATASPWPKTRYRLRTRSYTKLRLNFSWF